MPALPAFTERPEGAQRCHCPILGSPRPSVLHREPCSLMSASPTTHLSARKFPPRFCRLVLPFTELSLCVLIRFPPAYMK